MISISRRLRSAILLTGATAVSAGCGVGQPPDDLSSIGREVDLAHLLAGDAPVEASFVLLSPTAELTFHNPERSKERFLPASTFKIPNTLIALETGVASDAGFTIPFDSIRDRRGGFWTGEWSQDQTLRSAFQNSVYWFYQELARRVGEARMREYLRRFDYGNQDMGGGIDRFWLEGALRISPLEQVEFLRKVHEGSLGVSSRSTEILEEIMILQERPEYVLRGKTGTADVTASRELAWLIGFVDVGGSPWYFALNLEGEEVWERWGLPQARQQLVVKILYELGVLSDPDPTVQEGL